MIGSNGGPSVPTSLAVAAVMLASVVSVGAAGTPEDCGDDALQLPDGSCVHRSEKPPPGVDLRRRPTLDELKARRYGRSKQHQDAQVAETESGTSTAGAGTSIACIGDGVSGNRVQALYARSSNVGSRYDAVLPLIHRYAADADYAINVSAGKSGSGRRVRFATQVDCSLSVPEVTLSSSGVDTFSAMISELKAKGFDRSDRKYLIWVDAAVGICGLGQMYLDDRAGGDNRNNRGSMYARVDAPCWDYAEVHELIHTLGGVQDSSPNSTRAGHCVDENDTMCYVDTSKKSTRVVCSTAPSWEVDCGLDDYFNATPTAGSYLDSFWNTSRSSFLEGGPAPPAPPTISISVPRSVFAGNAFPVKASVSVPDGRSYSVRWSSSRTDCAFTRVGGLATSAYCPVAAGGSGGVSAKVTDQQSMSSSASATYKLAIPGSPRKTRAILRSSTTSIRRGRRAILRVKLRDATTGKAIIGMPLTVFAMPRGSTKWTKVAIRRTNVRGASRLRVSPRKTTAYSVVSGYTKTWRSAQSKALTITVRS
ncbi:MAG: hypothetical protein GEU78_05920 [Actinobacteria bacterium]|nr:hypothetical protein [Actinomycetota bacterium]